MADLSQIQSSQPVQIIGADNTGVEQTPVQSTNTGELFVDSSIRTGGTNGSLVTNTTAVIAKVGVTNLVNRRSLLIYNNGNSTIYWGYLSGTDNTNGIPIQKNQTVILEVTDAVNIYLYSSTAGEARIAEAA